MNSLTQFACVVLKHDARAMGQLAARLERRVHAPGEIIPIVERRVKRTLTNAVHRKGRKTA